jgi:zinc protease
MTADLLDEGTKTRSSLQIADELGSIGASLNTGASTDGSNISLSTLKKHLDKSLGVFTDVLTNPTFPQKDFERIRKQRITSLIQQRDQPVAIANNAFANILYSSKHPYGNNPTGTEASLNTMTTDDLKKFYASYYRPNNAVLIVVGDVVMDEIASQLERAVASWQSGTVPAFKLPRCSSCGEAADLPY